MGVSTTHPILSMLFTHTTSGPPVLFFASSPSSLLALNFKSAFSLQRIFRSQDFPCEDLQPIFEFGVFVFAILLHLHEKSLEIQR